MSYPWKSISPKDSLRLIKNAIFSDSHTSTVISLYQPLIGREAVSLYLLMKEYLAETTDKEVVLADILAQLSIDVQGYYTARIKLEAYGLVKVYKHKTDETHYGLVIQSPLTPQQFFSDSMMKMMLVEKVGQRLAKELEERFAVSKYDLHEFVEITKSFLDVIHVDMSKYSNNPFEEMQVQTENNQKPSDELIQNSSFDWPFFIEGLNKNYINSQSLTKDIRKTILTFHLLYGIDELEMQKLVLEASDITSGDVVEKKLTSVVHKKYLSQSAKKTEPVLSEGDSQKRTRQLKQKGFSDEEIEIILHAEATQPYSYLKSIKQQKGGFVTSSETWILKELVGNAPLSTAVINILLNYLLIIKDAPTLEKNLATKIANDWAQSKVASPEDAMIKVKQLYASFAQSKEKKNKPAYSKNYNKSSHARKETLPAWATETAEPDQRLTSKEEESYKEKLKRIRNKKSGE